MIPQGSEGITKLHGVSGNTSLAPLCSSVCSGQKAERIALMCLLEWADANGFRESLSAFGNPWGPTEVAE